MKKFLWLLCLTCCAAVFTAACDGDTTSGGATEDGGVTVNDINEINDQLSGIEGDIQGVADDLTSGLDDVNAGLGDANDAIDGIDGEVGNLQDQLADFFDPNACSEDASGLGICAPDGIEVTAAALAGIISAVCAHQIDCCDEGENLVRLGANIATQEDCEQLFVDSIENGQTPGDLQGVSGPVYYLIYNALDIGQAINSNDVQVSVDADAAAACEEFINEWTCVTEDPEETEFCTPWEYEEESNPCDAELIVVGHQTVGEVCGVTGVNECEPGLRCRYTRGNFGICATPSEAGDNCTQDQQCDGMQQFCNQATGECQERGDVGDDCSLIDPSLLVVFNDNNPGWDEGWRQNPGAVRIECKWGLACDPGTEKCVQNCTEGALCRGNYHCPEGLVCNFTANPDLYSNDNNSFYLGTCTDPIAEDGDCMNDDECATGHCEDGTCVAKTETGGDCAAATVEPSYDNTCETGYCDSDNHCATLCSQQVDCPSGFFCNTSNYVGQGDFDFACEPKGDNGDDCDTNYEEGQPTGPGTNFKCTSGHCDGTTGLCAAKLANGDLCDAHADCPSATHACIYDGVTDLRNECTPFLATNGDCSQVAGSLDYACGPGNYCWNNEGTYQCKPLVADGGTCDAATGAQCVSGLTCAFILSGADKCHFGGEFPVGADCDGSARNQDGDFVSGDSLCATGFCQTTDYTCQDTIAEGEDCDADDASNRCATGTYCKHDPDAEGADIGVGTCTAQATTGQACNPNYDRFGSGALNVHDCAGEGNQYYTNYCNLIRDQFVCNSYALAPESMLCDGI